MAFELNVHHCIYVTCSHAGSSNLKTSGSSHSTSSKRQLAVVPENKFAHGVGPGSAVVPSFPASTAFTHATCVVNRKPSVVSSTSSGSLKEIKSLPSDTGPENWFCLFG